MIDAFSYSFFQRALAAGVISGVLCGILSIYIIARRMAFIGQGISHAAFGGVALGLFFGINPLTPAALFAIAMAFGINFFSKHGRVSRDTIIGILLSSSMAIGAILIALSKNYSGSISSYLFGSILSVGKAELWYLIVVTFICLVFVGIFFKELKFIAFDERMAGLYGIHKDAIQLGLLVGIALAVIAAIQVLGIILVNAFLIIPGAIAVMLCRKYNSLFWVAPTIGAVSALIGLVISFLLNIPSGAAIVLLLAIAFVVVFTIKKYSGAKV
ncbi:metal ABC transporter permease [bacterium]|nr:metal ABC transporter permease [bacterium]